MRSLLFPLLIRTHNRRITTNFDDLPRSGAGRPRAAAARQEFYRDNWVNTD